MRGYDSGSPKLEGFGVSAGPLDSDGAGRRGDL